LDRLRSWLGWLPLAGAAITAMALLALWQDNFKRLPIESAWPTIAVAIAIALGVVAVLRPLTGSWARAGLISGLIAIYLFYVPAVLRLLHLPLPVLFLAHGLILAAVLLVSRRIPKDRMKVGALTLKANLVCLLLLVVTALPIAVQTLSLEGARREARQSFSSFTGQASPSSPDVWHILFDRYAGADTLQSIYGFDNRPFIAELRRRGFAVQDQAFSNYQRTGHSVASTVNGSYLDPMARPMSRQPDDWVPIYRAMRDNAASRFFKRVGYRTYFAGSWWEPTRFSNAAGESLEIRAMPQLARVAIDTSSLGLWTRGFTLPYLDGRGDQCFRANAKFRRLREIAHGADRKYVFAHFLVPHPPFVLNADGTCRSLAQAKASSRRDNYVAQVEFANREVLALIDAILRGPRPAVIVIHGDEGPWPEPHVGNEHGLGTDPVDVDWANLPPAKLREKMSTLLAMRAPDGAPATMPTSPVQIYPAILRAHFGSRVPMPPSRHYVFASDRQLYRFYDVTERVQRN
jgi:hypothetical protein